MIRASVSRRLALWLSLGCAAGCSVAAPAAEPSGLAWDRQPSTIALVQKGQVLWQFNYAPTNSKAFFHPLAVPGGPVLTANRPADHPWHRGLWFSWKYLNHLNYWEEDRKTGVAAGRTEWETPQIETRSDFSARIMMEVAYHPPEAPPVIREHRVISVSPPDAEGLYHLDWEATFKALDKDVVLDRTPLPGQPGGSTSGGYAGLSIRLSTDMTAPQADYGKGPVEFKGGRFRGKAGALDYSGVVDAHEAGVTILDNPANLNSPSPWYVIAENNFRFFTPAVICYEPYTLKAGESFTLRYRVIVHSGRWGEAGLRQATESYLREAKR